MKETINRQRLIELFAFPAWHFLLPLKENQDSGPADVNFILDKKVGYLHYRSKGTIVAFGPSFFFLQQVCIVIKK